MRLAHRVRRDLGRHADDWLITYADTITLLLCLFVIILSIRTGGDHHQSGDRAPPARHAVASRDTPMDIFDGHPPFPPPSADASSVPAPPALMAEAPAPVVVVEAPRAEAMPLSPLPPEALPPRPSSPGLLSPGPVSPRPLFPGLSSLRPPSPRPSNPIAAAPNQPSALPATAPADSAQPNAERRTAAEGLGDRITTLQISSATFFGSGDATLSAEGKSILRDVATTLRSPAFAGYHITIEGHTDDTPINTVQFQSNWELSTARAAAVVRFFLELGLPPSRLTAAGYADTFPIAPNRTPDGAVIPENQAKNRRVVIRLEKIDRTEQ